jgi:nitrogen regulatory protein P-II 1
MKKIEAYIRPQTLEPVEQALKEISVVGMTVLDAHGRGRSKGQFHMYRGSSYTLTLNPRLKLEIIVSDEMLGEAVEAIQKAAYTGEIGDGKIIVIPVEDVIHIRTGERGEIVAE